MYYRAATHTSDKTLAFAWGRVAQLDAVHAVLVDARSVRDI
jgi:hypothetical protein